MTRCNHCGEPLRPSHATPLDACYPCAFLYAGSRYGTDAERRRDREALRQRIAECAARRDDAASAAGE